MNNLVFQRKLELYTRMNMQALSNTALDFYDRVFMSLNSYLQQQILRKLLIKLLSMDKTICLDAQRLNYLSNILKPKEMQAILQKNNPRYLDARELINLEITLKENLNNLLVAQLKSCDDVFLLPTLNVKPSRMKYTQLDAIPLKKLLTDIMLQSSPIAKRVINEYTLVKRNSMDFDDE